MAMTTEELKMIVGGELIGEDPEGVEAMAYVIVRERDLKLTLGYVAALLEVQEAERDLADAYRARARVAFDPASSAITGWGLEEARAALAEASTRLRAYTTALHGTLPSLQQWGDFYFHSSARQRERLEHDAIASIAQHAAVRSRGPQ